MALSAMWLQQNTPRALQRAHAARLRPGPTLSQGAAADGSWNSLGIVDLAALCSFNVAAEGLRSG